MEINSMTGNERDEFSFKIKKLTTEKNLSVQFSMFISLLDEMNGNGFLPPIEETVEFLGHSFVESFNTVNTSKNALFMKLMLRAAEKDFIAEVIFVLMAIGKIQTLKWLYKKVPDIFKMTNMERLLIEISDGDGKFRYWEKNIVFWSIGKELK